MFEAESTTAPSQTIKPKNKNKNNSDKSELTGRHDPGTEEITASFLASPGPCLASPLAGSQGLKSAAPPFDQLLLLSARLCSASLAPPPNETSSSAAHRKRPAIGTVLTLSCSRLDTQKPYYSRGSAASATLLRHILCLPTHLCSRYPSLCSSASWNPLLFLLCPSGCLVAFLPPHRPVLTSSE